MKKAINKTERNEIIIALVAHGATKKAQAIVDKLSDYQKAVRILLLDAWQDQFPGISRNDQLALLQCHGANSLSFQPTLYTKKPDSKEGQLTNLGNFGHIFWRNTGTAHEQVRKPFLASRIFSNCAGRSNVVVDGYSSGFNSYLSLSKQFPDVIAGAAPKNLYDASVDLPEGVDPVLNDALLVQHTGIIKCLNEFRDLVDAAEDAYQKLQAALAPVKTAQALAELMPEAVKFFPSSLTYVKPTQEVADPKAINEIRAKLAKGLPI